MKFVVNVIIIRFNVELIVDFDIDYSFKNWNYIKTKVFLLIEIEKKNVCININTKITFVNRFFYKKQNFNNIVRIIIILLKIRELNIQQHKSYNYIICDIHLQNIKNNKFVISIIRREIYLINNFKVNILIDNNVINIENIILNSIKKQIFIISIDVIISIEVKLLKISI